MADVAEFLATQAVRYAVIGAMAACEPVSMRMLSWRCRSARAQTLRQALIEQGYEATLKVGDADDPIPALLEVRDGHGNRVYLLVGLRGMDPELLNRTRQVRLAGAILEISVARR